MANVAQLTERVPLPMANVAQLTGRVPLPVANVAQLTGKVPLPVCPRLAWKCEVIDKIIPNSSFAVNCSLQLPSLYSGSSCFLRLPFHLVSLDEETKKANNAKRKLQLATVRMKPTTIAVETETKPNLMETTTQNLQKF